LTQHDAQQTGPNFLAAILQSSATRALVKGGVAALTFQFIEPHLDPSLAAEPSQSAQQLVPGHVPINKTPGRRRQASNRACPSDQRRAGR
jgi:hypothetical protein